MIAPVSGEYGLALVRAIPGELNLGNLVIQLISRKARAEKRNMQHLAWRIALVTGSAGGIGLAIACALAGEG